MKRFKLYWDKDKEEKWLNEMVQQGWAMSNFFIGMYTFEKCQPGEYQYKIDLLDHLVGTKGALDYIKFVEETGAEFVNGWGRWAFFRKPTSEGAFELYTDIDSQIALYKKIRLMMGFVAILEFSIAYSQIHNMRYLNLGIPFYIIIGLLMTLGIVIGIAAIKAHFRVVALSNQKKIHE